MYYLGSGLGSTTGCSLPPVSRPVSACLRLCMRSSFWSGVNKVHNIWRLRFSIENVLLIIKSIRVY